MIIFIIFLLALATYSDGCLVVRTPNCECKVKALDKNSLDEFANSNPYYEMLTRYPIEAPIVEIDSCFAAVYCRDDLQLVLVEPKTIVEFGVYSAEGFCDRTTQTWWVDDNTGSGMKTLQQMYGICLNTNVCPCLVTEILPDNPGTYADQYKDYRDTHETSELTQKPTDDINCDFSLLSAYGIIAIFTKDRVYEGKWVEIACDRESRTWSLDFYFNAAPPVTGITNFDYMSFQKKVYPTNFTCPPFELLSGTGHRYNEEYEFDDSDAPVLARTRSDPVDYNNCYESLFCKGTHKMLYYYKNGDPNAHFMVELPHHPDDDMFPIFATISYHPIKEKWVVNGKATDVRAFICGSKTLVKYNTAPSPCPCLVTEILPDNPGTYSNLYQDYRDTHETSVISQYPEDDINCNFFMYSTYGIIAIFTEDRVYESKRVDAVCDKESRTWSLNLYYNEASPVTGITNFDYMPVEKKVYPTNFICPPFELLSGTGHRYSEEYEFDDSDAPVVNRTNSWPFDYNNCHKSLFCRGTHTMLYYYKNRDPNAHFIVELPHHPDDDKLPSFSTISYHPIKEKWVVNGKATDVRAFICGSKTLVKYNIIS